MFSARRLNSQTRPIAYLILSAMALVTDNPELPTVGESHTSTMTSARSAKFRSHCWPAVVEVVGVSMSVMTPAVVAGTPRSTSVEAPSYSNLMLEDLQPFQSATAFVRHRRVGVADAGSTGCEAGYRSQQLRTCAFAHGYIVGSGRVDG